tara:strand:- start:796 stop:960 length:165 start_codon:yes stop_codon:yes gene_type:complete
MNFPISTALANPYGTMKYEAIVHCPFNLEQASQGVENSRDYYALHEMGFLSPNA